MVILDVGPTWTLKHVPIFSELKGHRHDWNTVDTTKTRRGYTFDNVGPYSAHKSRLPLHFVVVISPPMAPSNTSFKHLTV